MVAGVWSSLDTNQTAIPPFFACIHEMDGETLPFDSRRGRMHYIPRIRKKIDIEHIPTKKEVYLMSDMAGNLRDKAIILTLFHSG